MSAHLLDVNMLIALAWPSHVHHAAAHRWFARHAAAGWATCPMTQCGFVRVSSNANVITGAVSPQEALKLMREMARHRHHAFWHDDVAMYDARYVPEPLIMGHRQVTDAYLLALAAQHGSKVATLDRGMRALAPPGTALHDTLVIVPPVE